MAWNNVSKVLDLEGPLEARRKKPAEWSDDRGKQRHEQRVQEEWIQSQCLLKIIDEKLYCQLQRKI